MKKYDLLTPEGTRDLLFDECKARRNIEDKLRCIFEGYGYAEVITPGLEFYDVFNSKTRYFAQESMYKLSDAKGRLMVMRPDSTMPIARLAATRLREEKLPLKLFNNQNIFRINPKNNARDDEITQSGIEIIGGDETKADLEVIAIAIETLKACAVGEFRIEIGNSAFFKKIISALSTSEEESEEIRAFIETKNYPDLNRALEKFGDNKQTKAVRMLPRLFGGVEVFELAEEILYDEACRAILDDVRCVFDYVCALGISDKVTVDLGLVNKANYYTGLLFRGYVEGYGMSVLSGGRYNTLLADFGENLPAIGFAVNVNAIAGCYLKQCGDVLAKTPDVLVYADAENVLSGFLHCKKLSESGMVSENSLQNSLEAAIEYASSRKIKRVDVVSRNETKSINLGSE